MLYAPGSQVARGPFSHQTLSAADEKLLADYQQKMRALLSSQLSWANLRLAMVDLYATPFSTSDIETSQLQPVCRRPALHRPYSPTS